VQSLGDLTKCSISTNDNRSGSPAINRASLNGISPICQQRGGVSPFLELTGEFLGDTPRPATTGGQIGKNEHAGHRCDTTSMVDFGPPWDIYILFAARLPVCAGLILRVEHEH
jgi:hypothetical protein